MENDESLKCLICLRTFNSPVAARCGHVYCWECIKAWLQSKDKQECPNCRAPIDVDNDLTSLFIGNNQDAVAK